MLGIIRGALATETLEQETEQVRRLIVRMGAEDYSARELMALVGISHRPSFLYGYLQPALAGGGGTWAASRAVTGNLIVMG